MEWKKEKRERMRRRKGEGIASSNKGRSEALFVYFDGHLLFINTNIHYSRKNNHLICFLA